MQTLKALFSLLKRSFLILSMMAYVVFTLYMILDYLFMRDIHHKKYELNEHIGSFKMHSRHVYKYSQSTNCSYLSNKYKPKNEPHFIQTEEENINMKKAYIADKDKWLECLKEIKKADQKRANERLLYTVIIPFIILITILLRIPSKLFKLLIKNIKNLFSK